MNNIVETLRIIRVLASLDLSIEDGLKGHFLTDSQKAVLRTFIKDRKNVRIEQTSGKV